MIDMGVDFGLNFGIGKLSRVMKMGKTFQNVATLQPMMARQWELIDQEIDGWRAEHPGEEFPMSDAGTFGFKLVTTAVTAALERAGLENLASGNLNKAIARRIATRKAKMKGVRDLSDSEMDRLVKMEMDWMRSQGLLKNKLKNVAGGVGGEIATEVTQSGVEWINKSLANWANADAEFKPFVVPEFASKEQKEDLWNTIKVTAGATLPLALMGAGVRSYSNNNIQNMDASQINLIRGLASNEQFYNMWVKNQQIRAEKEGTDPKELDKMISAANEMVSLMKSIDPNLGPTAQSMILPRLKAIKELENSIQKDGNKASTAKTRADIKLLEEQIQEISADPYYSA